MRRTVISKFSFCVNIVRDKCKIICEYFLRFCDSISACTLWNFRFFCQIMQSSLRFCVLMMKFDDLFGHLFIFFFHSSFSFIKLRKILKTLIMSCKLIHQFIFKNRFKCFYSFVPSLHRKQNLFLSWICYGLPK